MNKNKFIICFHPGSSGRFLASILHRLLFQIESEVKICNNNSAHDDWGGEYITNINDTLKYNSHDDIIITHDFPNYNLETMIDDRKKRIHILIRLSNDDIKEIYFNDRLKNNKIILKNKALDYMLKATNNKNWKIYHFISETSNFNNVVEINYQSIFEKENDNYKLFNILKDITGIENIPKSCYTALETYIKNRNELVQKYNLR